MSANAIEKIKQLVQEIKDSENFPISQRILTLRTAYHVYEHNYNELKALLLNAQNLDLPSNIAPYDRVQTLEEIEREITRLFHNCIAAAKTLVEHTRHHVKEWYADSPFKDIYQEEVQRRFVNNPLTGFVEDLRNYLLHYTLPSTMIFLENAIGLDTLHLGILQKSELLEWSGWTNKSRPYLEASEDHISILNLIDSYHIEIYGFQNWIARQLEQLHLEEIEWLIAKQAQVQEAAISLQESLNEGQGPQ